MVVSPLWTDCYDLAARVVEGSTGLVLDRKEKHEANKVTAKLSRLLSEPSFQEKAQDIARLQRDAGGIGAAVEIVLVRRNELIRSSDYVL